MIGTFLTLFSWIQNPWSFIFLWKFLKCYFRKRAWDTIARKNNPYNSSSSCNWKITDSKEKKKERKLLLFSQPFNSVLFFSDLVLKIDLFIGAIYWYREVGTICFYVRIQRFPNRKLKWNPSLKVTKNIFT